MKTTIRRAAGLFIVAVAALSAAACGSPSTVNVPDARSSWYEQQPQEPFPSYSYKRVGGG